MHAQALTPTPHHTHTHTRAQTHIYICAYPCAQRGRIFTFLPVRLCLGLLPPPPPPPQPNWVKVHRERQAAAELAGSSTRQHIPFCSAILHPRKLFSRLIRGDEPLTKRHRAACVNGTQTFAATTAPTSSPLQLLHGGLPPGQQLLVTAPGPGYEMMLNNHTNLSEQAGPMFDVGGTSAVRG